MALSSHNGGSIPDVLDLIKKVTKRYITYDVPDFYTLSDTRFWDEKDGFSMTKQEISDLYETVHSDSSHDITDGELKQIFIGLCNIYPSFEYIDQEKIKAILGKIKQKFNLEDYLNSEAINTFKLQNKEIISEPKEFHIEWATEEEIDEHIKGGYRLNVYLQLLFYYGESKGAKLWFSSTTEGKISLDEISDKYNCDYIAILKDLYEENKKDFDKTLIKELYEQDA